MADTESVKQETTANEQEKTFTQEEVNKFVQSRIIDIEKKYQDYESLKTKADQFDALEEAQKTELQKATERADALQAQIDSMNKEAEIRNARGKVANELNVPAELLTGTTEEACRAQAEAILKFAKPNGSYPTVKDGGDPTPATMSKEAILSIKNDRERLKAIQDNIELFK